MRAGVGAGGHPLSPRWHSLHALSPCHPCRGAEHLTRQGKGKWQLGWP